MNLLPETAWCVEKGGLFRPTFLTVEQGRTQWRAEHEAALRFARQEDAERVARMFKERVRVVEHLWA